MKPWRKAVIVLVMVVLLQVLIGATISEAAPSNAGGVDYRVSRGETPTGIAARYCTTVWCIANADGIWNPNYIYAGQVLYIPSGCGCCGCNYYPPPCFGPSGLVVSTLCAGARLCTAWVDSMVPAPRP